MRWKQLMEGGGKIKQSITLYLRIDNPLSLEKIVSSAVKELYRFLVLSILRLSCSTR